MAGLLTPIQAVYLFVAAILAGALNSVAGGGSFITFPSLVFAGVPQLNANATNAVALWPGTVASVGAYRHEFGNVSRRLLITLGITSFIGGILGSILLLLTPETTFRVLVPFLLLFATLLFTFSPSITAWVRKQRAKIASTASDDSTQSGTWTRLIPGIVIQLIIATYGGYFGGGIGIMMLAMLGFLGLQNIHQMNALKTLFATLINGITAILLSIAGIVYWPQAVLMAVGASIGGYFGAYFARRIAPSAIRQFVIVVGFVMTAYFFYNTFFAVSTP